MNRFISIFDSQFTKVYKDTQSSRDNPFEINLRKNIKNSFDAVQLSTSQSKSKTTFSNEKKYGSFVLYFRNMKLDPDHASTNPISNMVSLLNRIEVEEVRNELMESLFEGYRKAGLDGTVIRSFVEKIRDNSRIPLQLKEELLLEVLNRLSQEFLNNQK